MIDILKLFTYSNQQVARRILPPLAIYTFTTFNCFNWCHLLLSLMPRPAIYHEALL